MKTKWIIFVAVFAGVIILGLWATLGDWTRNSPSKYPLQTAEAMLQTIATRASEPDFTPEPWEVGEQECQDLLQAIMILNKNQYTLVVAGIFGDHGTPIPGTGADEVLINVVFPDRSQIEMQFYAGTLDVCSPLENTA